MAAQTAAAWPTAQISAPGIQSRRPSAIAAASVPLAIATVRGAPPIRIGSVSARWTGAKKPGTSGSTIAAIRPAPRRRSEKKDRKKLDAAKAIDRPKTIWISRRKPPDVSPKASVRPVTVMMITEMILATGPCTDSRMELSGVSHGMEEPEA